MYNLSVALSRMWDMEYGAILGLLFWLLFYKKIRSIAKVQLAKPKREYIRFLSIYLMLIMFVQNYIEYPEIVFPFILLIKLAEVDTVNTAPVTVKE